jgi:hypothetical protein
LAGSAFTAEAIATLLNFPVHGDGFTILFAVKLSPEKKARDLSINDSSSIISLTILFCRNLVIAKVKIVRTRFKVVIVNK